MRKLAGDVSLFGWILVMQAQNNKRTLYVGGLSPEVTERLLFGAFVPFGEISTVNIAVTPGNSEYLPLFLGIFADDQARIEQRKGYGFVEFEQAEDAKAALDNMDNAELCGRVLYVKIAKAQAATDKASKWNEWSCEWWIDVGISMEFRSGLF